MSDGKKWKVVTVRMTEELRDALKHEAWTRQISLNELCVLRVACEPLPERCVPEEEVNVCES